MIEQTKSAVNNRSELRERIIEVANAAFRERGIKGLKMDELAAKWVSASAPFTKCSVIRRHCS